MDQTVLAGVGNVYRAELLFRHRLDPMRPGRTLRVSQWQAVRTTELASRNLFWCPRCQPRFRSRVAAGPLG